jgi:hypothetical protein
MGAIDVCDYPPYPASSVLFEVTKVQLALHDGGVMSLIPAEVARALGGVITNNTSVLAPGPGHSSMDRPYRSKSIRMSATVSSSTRLLVTL